jgi:hypothetical protein
MDDEVCCPMLSEFSKVQLKIIQKHLDSHKWLRHIEDKNIAVADFINLYAWLIREVFCESSCELRGCCEVRKNLSKQEIK